MKQGVPIALLASEAADARIRRLGIDSWSSLFYPFSEVSFNIREPSSGNVVSGKRALDFRDLKKQGYLLSLTVLLPTLQEALLTCSTLEECQQKFQHYFTRFVEPCEYETFRTYLACVFLVAGCEEKPINELSSLIQLQNTQQHGTSVDGNVLAPSHCAPPRWRAPNTLKHYIVVHDCTYDDEAKTQETFRQLCSTYGSDSCQLLRVGSGDGSDLIDVWRDIWEETEVLQRGLIRARSALVTKSSKDNKDHTNLNATVATISPGFVITGVSNGTDGTVESASFESFYLKNKRNVSTEDREVIRTTLQEFTEKNLVPYVERLMRSLQEAVGQRRGIPRSLTANMKKWFATPAVAQTANVSYTNESVEMQSRRLADLYFEFGLYEKAHQQYQNVKKEFASDNAWMHHAAALDMSCYTYYLSNLSITAKNFPVRYFENALTHFLSTNVRYTCPLRCVLQAYEVLTNLELNVEAAMQLVKITQMDMDNCVAVCLSMAALAFEKAKMHRKAAFYRVLAGNRFTKAVLPALAIECYRTALFQYFEKNWDHAEDFLALAISKECNEPKLSFSCAARLLRACDHQSTQQQSDHLNHFVFIVKEFGLDVKERIRLKLPIIDAHTATVICGERPTSQAIVGNRMDKPREDDLNEEHPWEEIQRAAYHSLAGPSSAFQYICVVSDHSTDNTKFRETPAGERFRVMVKVKNPLNISIRLRNLKLGIADIKLRENPPSNSNDFQEISNCAEVLIDALGEKMIELYVRPFTNLAHFVVSDIQLELEASDRKMGTVSGFIPLAVKGPRLNKKPDHKKGVFYAVDRRLEVNVSQSRWPLLDVEMEKPLPDYVFCGQAVRIIMKIENIGDESVSGFCISSDGVDCTAGGIFDTSGARVLNSSHISENNTQIRVLTFPNVSLAKRESKRIFVDIRAPQQPSKLSIGLLLFYRGVNGAFREQRISVPLRCRPLLAAHGCLLDPIHGLLSLDVRNEIPISDAALARIDICRITAHLVHIDQKGNLVETPDMLALRPIRLRSVQLDCAQSDSVCVSVTGAFSGSSSYMWLSPEISDCPSFPLPFSFCMECVPMRPTLLLTLLWKASIVNNQGQVSSILGESIVFDPFAAAGLRIPGVPWPVDEEITEDSRGIYIYVGHLSPVVHDFQANRLCEFPIELHIRNDENRDCALNFRFTPKIPLPLSTPLPVDSRQQWWIDREEWSIRLLSAHSEIVSTIKIRVAHPSFYDLLGSQLQAKAIYSDGSETIIPVPPVHALVTSHF